MTGADHEHSEWFSEQNPGSHPAGLLLRSQFNLSAVETCEVIAMAQRSQTRRGAHG